MTAVMSAIPVIAAVLTFVTYSLSGHQLNVATIFTVGLLAPFVSVLNDSLTLLSHLQALQVRSRATLRYLQSLVLMLLTFAGLQQHPRPSHPPTSRLPDDIGRLRWSQAYLKGPLGRRDLRTGPYRA